MKPKHNGRPRRQVDFDDEKSVLAEMAEELDVDPDDLEIQEDNSWSPQTLYRVRLSGPNGKEWHVARNDEDVHDVAIAIVKQTIRDEPEVFTEGFLANHIDTDRLARDLRSDVESERHDYYSEMNDASEFWAEAERHGMQAPDKDDDGELRDPTEEEISTLSEKSAEDLLEDPMKYLEDIYGESGEATKKAIEIAGVDEDKAADDAVSVDGEGHFLSSYDGQVLSTKKNSLPYWRVN